MRRFTIFVEKNGERSGFLDLDSCYSGIDTVHERRRTLDHTFVVVSLLSMLTNPRCATTKGEERTARVRAGPLGTNEIL